MYHLTVKVTSKTKNHGLSISNSGSMKRRPFCRVLSWILAALGRLWMILTSKLCDWAEKSSNRRSFCGELSHDHSLVDVDERTSRMEWLLGFNMLAQLSPMVNVSYHFISYIISLNPWKTSTSLVGRRASCVFQTAALLVKSPHSVAWETCSSPDVKSLREIYVLKSPVFWHGHWWKTSKWCWALLVCPKWCAVPMIVLYWYCTGNVLENLLDVPDSKSTITILPYVFHCMSYLIRLTLW